jgi:hypothetical protein
MMGRSGDLTLSKARRPYGPRIRYMGATWPTRNEIREVLAPLEAATIRAVVDGTIEPRTLGEVYRPPYVRIERARRRREGTVSGFDRARARGGAWDHVDPLTLKERATPRPRTPLSPESMDQVVAAWDRGGLDVGKCRHVLADVRLIGAMEPATIPVTTRSGVAITIPATLVCGLCYRVVDVRKVALSGARHLRFALRLRPHGPRAIDGFVTVALADNLVAGQRVETFAVVAASTSG